MMRHQNIRRWLAAAASVLLLAAPQRVCATVTGDLNGDDAVNSTDAAIVLAASALAGSGNGTGLTEEQQTAGDVNADGRLNASDAAMILLYAAQDGAGLQVTFAGLLAEAAVEATVRRMSLDEKLHQLFILTPEMLTGSSRVTQYGTATQKAIDTHPVGGIIYFADNLQTVSQAKGMLSGTQQYATETTGIGMFLAVDEEGGRVARVAKKLGMTAFSPMKTYGNRNDAAEAFSIGETIGRDITGIGFNVDFAPVADVNLNSGNELGDRIFSSDPAVVANMVSGVVRGLQSQGAAATLKHFPGLGAENGNAHTDKAVVIDRTLAQLRAEEFVPFRSGIAAGTDFIMVSHQIVTGVGDNLPASLSEKVCTELLREELGFEGIIVTDSLRMNTVSGSYSAGEAAVMAIEAGVDIVLMPKDFTAALKGLQDAVESGRLTEARIDESVKRILKEKQKLGLLSEVK